MRKFYFAIALVAALAHWPLVGSALHRLHSDYAATWLGAEEIARGHFSAFVFDMNYAGTVLTTVRAAWITLARAVSDTDHARWMAQATFSYTLVPMAMALAGFWAMLGVGSVRIAALSGLLVAFGFPLFDEHFHNDVYTLNFIFACLALGIRARVVNPWRELSRTGVFTLAALTGLMIYHSRINLIAATALWLPPFSELRLVKSWLFGATGWRRWLMRTGFAFFSLFLFLEIHGADLGAIAAKRVVIHASPNLTIALLLWIAVAASRGGVAFLVRERAKLAVVGAGLLLGFMPELWHWIALGQLPPAGTGSNNGAMDLLKILVRVPPSLMEIFARPEGGARGIAAALWLPTLFWVFWAARKDRRFEAVAVLLALAIFAYARVRNYADAPARYLFPALPALTLGLVPWIERLSRRTWIRATLVVCLSLHGLSLVQNRIRITREALASPRLAEIHKVIQIYRQQGVKIVGSQEYWFSNELSYVSRLDPVFFSPDTGGLMHPLARPLWKSEKKRGYIASAEPLTVPESRVLLGKVGSRWLYLEQSAN